MLLDTMLTHSSEHPNYVSRFVLIANDQPIPSKPNPSETETVLFLTDLFLDSENLLSKLDNSVFERGFRELLWPNGFGYFELLYSQKVPINLRVACIEALESFYQNQLCIRVSGKAVSSSKSAEKIDTFAYMLWENFPTFSHLIGAERELLLNTSVRVLHSIKKLKNTTCVDSAIHGLHHFYEDHPDLYNL